MKRVRFVQFYAILQFGTMGSIFMNLVLDLDFLSMEVITCEPPLELVLGTFKKLDSNSPGCPSMLILFICRLSERKTCCTDWRNCHKSEVSKHLPPCSGRAGPCLVKR